MTTAAAVDLRELGWSVSTMIENTAVSDARKAAALVDRWRRDVAHTRMTILRARLDDREATSEVPHQALT